VQVKSNVRADVPFFLLVRDVSQQIDTLTANGKYADDVSDSLVKEQETDADRKFTISIPKADSYFPVIRYKCLEDLRPVPIVSSVNILLFALFGNYSNIPLHRECKLVSRWMADIVALHCK
jgi:hypothetical protein